MTRDRNLRPLSILAVLCLLVACAGCSDDDDPTGPGSNAWVGVWEMTSATLDGTPVPIENHYSTAATERVTLTFAANGSLTTAGYDAQDNLIEGKTGSYTLDGSTYTLTLQEEGGPETTAGTWQIAGDVLTITFQRDGDSHTISLTRLD